MPVLATATDQPDRFSAAVDGAREGGRRPAQDARERAVEVDQLAEGQAGGQDALLDVGVEPEGGDPDEGDVIDVPEVNRRGDPGAQDGAGRNRVERDPDGAAEVVTAAARQDTQDAPSGRDGARDPADEPVTAHRDDDPVVAKGLRDEGVGVLERPGRRHDYVMGRQRRLDRREPAGPPTATGSRVDDQLQAHGLLLGNERADGLVGDRATCVERARASAQT